MKPCLYFLLKNVYRMGLIQLFEAPNLCVYVRERQVHSKVSFHSHEDRYEFEV